jgi:putative ABC transport system ATP-binding protein
MVRLEQVTKVYPDGDGRRPALDRVSLDVEDAQFVAVLGPSGSGKSTLLNLVAGLDRATRGRVTVGGQELDALVDSALVRFRREHIGLVFQFFNLLPTLTVLENVLLPAQLAGTPDGQARRWARELLDRLGVLDLAGRVPGRLSGGQQQLVAIARALVNRPRLLLADEPTGALGNAGGAEVMRLLVQLNRMGQTVLLVTHDAQIASRHAQRVISLDDGCVIDEVHLPPRLDAARAETPSGRG